jgi:hypothetical protein
MAKLKVSISKVISEMLAGNDDGSDHGVTVMRIFSSSQTVCPLCHSMIPAYTKHECRKESK